MAKQLQNNVCMTRRVWCVCYRPILSRDVLWISMKLRSTCRSNRQLVAFDIRHVECYKLPVASTCWSNVRHVACCRSTCCFDMLLVWTGL